MSWSRSGALQSVVVLTLVTAMLAGCAPLTPPTLQPTEDPVDYIHIARYGAIAPSTRQVLHLPSSMHRGRWFFLAGRAAPRPLPASGKLDPALIGLTGGPSTPVHVMVTFVDTVTITRFPTLGSGTARHGTPKDAAAIDTVHTFIDELRTRRTRQDSVGTAILTSFGATQIHTFWLIQAASCVMPLSRVGPLSARPEVRYVRLDRGPEAPNHDGVRANDVDAARASIGSDTYYELGPTGGYMALLDTGVRTTHRLLWNPTSCCMVADCVTGVGMDVSNINCSPTLTDGAVKDVVDRYQEGHGTSTAAILIGNGTIPQPEAGQSTPPAWFRGVTTASLDCFTVYGSDRALVPSAVVRGFELARERLDQVIVAEMQDTGPEMADIATAADKAFETGAVVIAANGNDAPTGTGYPARGRRVIGVGAFHLQFDADVQGMAWGSTGDGRLKPDLLAPSYTETAGNAGDDDMRYHGGTSGATPYVAGAALLLRNWMNAYARVPSYDPGQAYVLLILAGEDIGPFASDSRRGVGRFHLPESGSCWYGKTWVSDASRPVDIPIDVDAAERFTQLDAAIWWPETTPVPGGPTDTHNDVDLALVSPSGTTQALSNGANGVFERTRVQGSPTLSGQWKLRIAPYTMRTGPQIVYWAASLKK